MAMETIMRNGKPVKRRKLTREQLKERGRKTAAAWAAKRAAKQAKGAARAGKVGNGHAVVAEPKSNGAPATWGARVNDALVYLGRARVAFAHETGLDAEQVRVVLDKLVAAPVAFNTLWAEAILRHG